MLESGSWGQRVLQTPALVQNEVSFFGMAMSYQKKTFVFSVSVLSQMLTSKFYSQNWSDLCSFYSKVIFWNFHIRKYFCFSTLIFNHLCFTTIR